MSNALCHITDDNVCVKLPPMAIETREDSAGADNVVDDGVSANIQYPTVIKSDNKHSDMKPEDVFKNSLTDKVIMNDKEKLLTEAKKEFHTKRHLILKNVPVNATDEDIRKGFEERLEIKEITFNRSLQIAKINLLKPELLDSWPREELQYEVLDQMTIARVSDTDGMLCVAHLPFIYTEDDFRNLVQMYGPVASCFLCRSEKTGEHKGYGFVEYSSREVAYKAKPLLEKKIIGDCQIKCCWLEPSYLTYNSLHSKCLFVDHLPNGFRDLVEFRRIFSVVTSPSYSQIGFKNGQPLGFGLVEFDNADDAEETQKLLNHSKLDDHQIRVTYCAPGYRAMVVYNKLISGLMQVQNAKQPLLPDPPRNSISMPNSSLYQSQPNSISGRSWENGHRVSNGSFNEAQQLPLNTPTSNSSLQEAVVLLLAAQVQSQQNSILNNPQSLTLMLQAANGQQTNVSETQEMADALRNILQVLQQTNGHTRCQMPTGNVSNGGNCQWQPPKSPDGKIYSKVPLLPDPPCVKQMETGGLLPTPSISKLHPNAFCNGQGNFLSSALHNGNQQQPLFVKTQTEVISKTPYENQGRQKVPLLGDKPANVPLSGPNSIGPMDRSAFSLLNQSNSTGDPIAIAQLLAPIIRKQSQLLQNAKLTKMNENLVLQQSKNGNGIQAVQPAVINLLLQSIQRLQQGELQKAGAMPNQNGFHFPFNVSYPSPNLYIGASTMAQKQVLFGSSPLISPQAPGPRPSHVLTMSPPGASKPPVYTQPFLFHSQSQNGLPNGPLAAAQLMAEIQQRGSLLGDFWQATQALGGARLINHYSNEKVATPIIAHVGYNGLAKRKLSFPSEVANVSDVDQLKKRRV